MVIVESGSGCNLFTLAATAGLPPEDRGNERYSSTLLTPFLKISFQTELEEHNDLTFVHETRLGFIAGYECVSYSLLEGVCPKDCKNQFSENASCESKRNYPIGFSAITSIGDIKLRETFSIILRTFTGAVSPINM